MNTYHFKEDHTLIDISKIPIKKYEWERERTAREMAYKVVLAKDEKEARFVLEHPEHEDIVSIHCYADTDYMKRESALEFYKEAMLCSEGAERERYIKIYTRLALGKKNVSDI